MSNFNFVGNLVLPKDDENFFKHVTAPNEYVKLGFMVKASENNAGFVNVFGSPQETLVVSDKDDTQRKLSIKWADRNNPKYVAQVAQFRKYRTNVGCQDNEVKEFISPYDFAMYLSKNLKDVSADTVVRVTGRLNRSEYNGRVMNNFDAQGVWVQRTSDVKLGLFVSAELVYSKTSLDDADDNRWYLNAYTEEYINKEQGLKFLPFTAQFEVGKLNMNNEVHKKVLKSRLGYLRDNIKSDYVMMSWDLSYIRGAEEVPFDDSMLTDAQRDEIELGIKTIDDFKSKPVYGSNTEFFRLVAPNLTPRKYQNGLLDAPFSVDEFEEKIYRFQPRKEEVEATNGSEEADSYDDIFDILN